MYMNRFHLFIIKDLNFRGFSTKGTPFFKSLILTTQISSFFILIMPICSLLLEVVPLDCAVAICSDIILCTFWFPFKTSARIFNLSRSVTDAHDFSLVNVVDSDLAVWTCCSDVFVVRADFEWENLSVNVTEKVH